MSVLGSVSRAIRNPRATTRRTVSGLLSLVTDPDGFFERRAGQSGMRRELAIVVVAGLVGVALMFYVQTRLTIEYPANLTNPPSEQGDKPGLNQMTWIWIWGYVLQPLMGGIGVWLVVGLLSYAVTWLQGAKLGNLTQVLRLIAYGFVPIAVANLLYFGTWAVGFTGRDLPDDDELPLGGGREDKVLYIFDEVRTEPYVIGAAIVGIALYLYAGHLWAYAVKNARRVDITQARIAVAVPMLVVLFLPNYGIVSNIFTYAF